MNEGFSSYFANADNVFIILNAFCFIKNVCEMSILVIVAIWML